MQAAVCITPCCLPSAEQALNARIVQQDSRLFELEHTEKHGHCAISQTANDFAMAMRRLLCAEQQGFVFPLFSPLELSPPPTCTSRVTDTRTLKL